MVLVEFSHLDKKALFDMMTGFGYDNPFDLKEDMVFVKKGSWRIVISLINIWIKLVFFASVASNLFTFYPTNHDNVMQITRWKVNNFLVPTTTCLLKRTESSSSDTLACFPSCGSEEIKHKHYQAIIKPPDIKLCRHQMCLYVWITFHL